MTKSLELVICAGDDPTEVLEILNGRIEPKFLEELRADGGGSFSIFRDDQKLREVPNLLDYRNIVRCRVNGVFTSGFIIQNDKNVFISTEEKSGEGVEVAGSGFRSWFADATVHPYGPVRPGASDDRVFSFASEQGTWYDSGSWVEPYAMQKVSEKGDTNRWRYNPAEWPDEPNAKWIWDRNSATSAPAGDVYFRAEFTTSSTQQFAFFIAVDDGFQVYLDSQLVAESDINTTAYKGTTRVDFTIDAGPHIIAVKAHNNAGPAAFLGTLRSFGNPLVPSPAVTAFSTGTPGIWKVLGYPENVPGWTPGEVMLKLLAEAQTRGVRFPTFLTPTFTATLDSNGAPWPVEVEWSFSLGSDYSTVVSTMESLGYDVWINPDTLELNMAPVRGTDKSSGASPVILRKGFNLLAAGEEGQADVRNSLLVQSADGWEEKFYTDTTSYNKYGRLEGTLSTDASAAFTDNIAKLTFQEKALPEIAATFSVIPVEDAMPGEDYVVGDYVSAPDRNGEMVPRRVYSLSFGEDDNGIISYAVEFDGVFQDKIDKLEQQIERLNKGVNGYGGISTRTTSSTVVGSAPASDPGRVPEEPISVTASSQGYWSADGSARSRALLSWSAVTLDTNGASIDVPNYEVWGRQSGSTATQRFVTQTTLSATLENFLPGTTWLFKVRAFGASNVFGDFSDEVSVTMALPTAVLGAPSQPTVTSALGSVTVRWDGLIGGAAPAPEFDYVLVKESTTETGTYVTVGQPLREAGSAVVTGHLPDDVFWYRLYAVNKLGLVSPPSTAKSIVVVGIDTGDLDGDVADAIQDAYDHADDALTLAATKNKTYTQTSAPTLDLVAGDLWYDSDDGNKPYRWSGVAWVAIPDATIAAAQATANSKNKVYSQGTAPTGPNTVGDTWFDTANGNAPKRWDGSTWVLVRDTTIATAQSAATTAQNTANTAVTNAAAAQAAADTLFATSQDYIQNPSFETVGLWWIMEGVANYGATTSHTGLRNGLVTGGTGTIKTPMIAAAAGTRWRLIYWLYTQAAPTGGVRIANASDATIGGLTTVFPNTSSVWVKYTYDFTVPVGSTEFRIRFASSSGSFRVDDISLLDITAAYAAQAAADAAQATANTAISNASAAQSTADGKGKVYFQTTAPVPALAQDLWIDTTGSANTPKRWNGTSWVTVQDASIAAAQAAADAAQSTANGAVTSANGKNKTYTQGTPPTGTLVAGDLWFDTSNGNRVNRYSGSAWVLIVDTAIAAAQSTADGKGKIYFQPTAPTPALAQDLWIDTTSSANTPKRWNGTAWVSVSDKIATDAAAAAAAAASAASAAQTTANGKNKSYTQGTAPTPPLVDGDLWFNTLAGNAVSRWNGTTWVLVADAAIGAAQATADGKGKIYFQTSAPSPALAQDLWIDTTGGANTPKRWNGTAWVSVTDKIASDAAAAAAAAQGTADGAVASANGKNKVVFSSLAASGTSYNGTPFVVGDSWFRRDGTGQVIGIWEYTATNTWTPRTITDAVLSNISAATITTGTLSADRIASNSISVAKLSVGDFTNLTDDPTFAGTGWTKASSPGLITLVTTTGAPGLAYKFDALPVGSGIGAALYNNNVFQCTAGDQYFLSFKARNDLNQPIYWRIQFFDSTGASLTTLGVATGTTAPNTWVTTTGTVTAPTNAVSAMARVDVPNTANTAGASAWFAQPIMRRINGGELIVDGAITTTKLSALSVTAAKIAVGTITAVQMATGTITAASGIIGSLDAAVIVAGTITGDKVAVNTITGNKLLIGDFTNMVDNPGFEYGLTGWSAANAVAVTTPVRTGTTAASLTGSASVISQGRIPVQPGDTFYVSCWYQHTVTPTGTLGGIRVRNQIGADFTGGQTTFTSSVGVWAQSTKEVVIPAGVTEIRFGVATATTAGSTIVDDMIIRRKNGGELIVDGSITTNSLSAGAVTAAKIATGTITAVQMATGTITAASGIIASLDAGVISTGTLNAARIGAGSITGDKLVANTITSREILIGDYTNYASGADFESDATNPFTMAGQSIWTIDATVAHTGSRSMKAAGNVTSGGVTFLPSVTVTEGEQIYIELWAMSDAAFNGTISNSKFRAGNQSNALITPATVNIHAAALTPGTWVKRSILYTVTAGVTALRFTMSSDATAGNVWVDDVVIRKMTQGTYIVDGAITTAKIDVGAVTAAKIAAGTITAALIAANTITAGQIAAGTITATEIAANTITAAKIAAHTITSNEILAHTITAAEILANTITSTEIAAHTITANEIAADTITANEIASNAITVNELAANAVTAVKIATGVITADKMIIGDFTNFVDDPGFETITLEGWANTGSVATTGTAGTFRSGTRAAIFGVGTRSLTSTNAVPVKTGDQFYISVWYKHSVTPVGTLGGLRLVNQSGADIAAFTTTFVASTAGFTQSQISGTIPAGVTAVRIKVTTGTTTGSTYVDDIEFRRKSGGELIVDGGITARNIQAQSITTDRLVISDFSNLIENPGFEQNLVGWATGATAAVSVSTPVRSGLGAAQLPAGAFLRALNTLQVKAGDPFYISVWYRHASTPSSSVANIGAVNNDTGDQITELTVTMPSSVGSWAQAAIAGVVPAGVSNISIYISNLSNVTMQFDDTEVRRRSGGELIVDGSITALKIAAGAIQSQHIQVGAKIPTGEENQRVPAEMTDIVYWQAVQAGTIDLEGSTSSVYPRYGATPTTAGMSLVPGASTVARQQITAMLPVPVSRKVYTKYTSTGTIYSITNLAWNPSAESRYREDGLGNSSPFVTSFAAVATNLQINSSFEAVQRGAVWYRNYVLNPSFETDLSGWTVGSPGGLSFTRSTAWSAAGGASAQLTPTAGAGETFIQTLLDPSQTGPGTYFLRATIRLTAAQTGTLHARSRAIYVLYTNSSGTQVGTLSAQAPNAAGVYNLSMSLTLPDNITDIAIRLYNGSSVAGSVVWWDRVMMTKSSVPVRYFDGTETMAAPYVDATGELIYPDIYISTTSDGYAELTADAPITDTNTGSMASWNAAAGRDGGMAVSSTEWAYQGKRSVRVTSNNESGTTAAGMRITGILSTNSGVNIHVGAYLRLDQTQSATGTNSRRLMVVWLTTPDFINYTENGNYSTVGTAPNAAGVYEIRGDVTRAGDAFYVAVFGPATSTGGDVWADMVTVSYAGYTGPLFDYATTSYPGLGQNLELAGGPLKISNVNMIPSRGWNSTTAATAIEEGRMIGFGHSMTNSDPTVDDPATASFRVTFRGAFSAGTGLQFAQGDGRNSALNPIGNIVQGQTYTCAMWVKVSKQQRMNLIASAMWGFESVGQSVTSPAVVVPANTWTRLSVTFPIAVDGAHPTYNSLWLQAVSTTGTGYTAWASGDWLQGDHVTIVQGTLLDDFFSGDTGTAFWTGKPNSSPSVKNTGGIQILSMTPSGAVISPALFDGAVYELPATATSYAAFLMQDPRGGSLVVSKAKVFEVVGSATGQSGVEISPAGVRVSRDDGTVAASFSGNGIEAFNEAGLRTFYVDPITGQTTIVGGSFVTTADPIANPARTELTPLGFQNYNADGQVAIQIGYGNPSGMSVLDPGSKRLVPLGPQVFGTLTFSNAGNTFVNMPGGAGQWGAWRDADLAGQTFTAMTGRALVTTFMSITGGQTNWTYEAKVRFKNPDGSYEVETSTMQFLNPASPPVYMYAVNLVPGRIYTPIWSWRVYQNGSATGTPGIGSRTVTIQPI